MSQSETLLTYYELEAKFVRAQAEAARLRSELGKEREKSFFARAKVNTLRTQLAETQREIERLKNDTELAWRTAERNLNSQDAAESALATERKAREKAECELGRVSAALNEGVGKYLSGTDAALAEAQEVLRELVRLKDLKELIEANPSRDWADKRLPWNAREREYSEKQPLAWKAARDFLKVCEHPVFGIISSEDFPLVPGENEALAEAQVADLRRAENAVRAQVLGVPGTMTIQDKCYEHAANLIAALAQGEKREADLPLDTRRIP